MSSELTGTPSAFAIFRMASSVELYALFGIPYPGCQRSSRSPAARNVRVSSADRRETSGLGS